jgi:hypothetical protein
MKQLAPPRLEVLAWGAALVLAAIVLALLGYEARDADSRLYAEIAAEMAARPVSGWIAPTVPAGWYVTGLFREHPVGIHLLPAFLARMGYPALQAAFVANALYQVLGLVLLQRLAATVAGGLESRALGWVVQLLPIAFTFRIRANHEQALLLCLLLSLYGTERATRRAAWGLAVVAGIVGLLLVKGVLVLTGLAVCGLWLLARHRIDPKARIAPALGALFAASLAAMATAWLYERMYREATGQAFWSVYLARQLSVAAADQSAKVVSSTSSMSVPCPGRRGSSTAKPAAASASATPRIEFGLPVNPCSASAPCGPPAGEDQASAPAITGRVSSSAVRVIVLRLLPPVLGRGFPVGVGVDAVDGAGVEALVAPRAELRDDDHVHPVVEDRPELRGAVSDARVAVDADRHVDQQRRVLPLRVPLAILEPLGP